MKKIFISLQKLCRTGYRKLEICIPLRKPTNFLVSPYLKTKKNIIFQINSILEPKLYKRMTKTYKCVDLLDYVNTIKFLCKYQCRCPQKQNLWGIATLFYVLAAQLNRNLYC